MNSQFRKIWKEWTEALWEDKEDIPEAFQNLKYWENSYYPVIEKLETRQDSIYKEKKLFSQAGKLQYRYRYLWAAILLIGLLGFTGSVFYLFQLTPRVAWGEFIDSMGLSDRVELENPYRILSHSSGVHLYFGSKKQELENWKDISLDWDSRILFQLEKYSYLELDHKKGRKIILHGPGMYSLEWKRSDSQGWTSLLQEQWKVSYGKLYLDDEPISTGTRPTSLVEDSDPGSNEVDSWEIRTDHAQYRKLGTQVVFETNSLGDKIVVLDGKILAESLKTNIDDPIKVQIGKNQKFQIQGPLGKRTPQDSAFWKLEEIPSQERKKWKGKSISPLSANNGLSQRKLSLQELRRTYPQLQKVVLQDGERIEGYVFMRGDTWFIHGVDGIQKIDWESIQSIENF